MEGGATKAKTRLGLCLGCFCFSELPTLRELLLIYYSLFLMRIYIIGLGYRNALKEHSQVIWFIQEVTRKMNASARTKYFLNFKEAYFEKLKEAQAFELCAFISNNVTELQEKRRSYYRKQAKRIAMIETQKVISAHEKRKTLHQFQKNICLN